MWKKGESGNPAGGQRRKLITGHIERELMQLAEDAEKDGDATKARRIAEKVIALAMAGNPWAIQFVTERTEGKPDQNVNITRSVREMTDADLADIAAGSSEGTPRPKAGKKEPARIH
jgi:hypothetical protein